MIKVLAIFKAPAPYIDPLFRLFAEHPKIDLTVVYCVKTTDGEFYFDKIIKKKVSWGTKLLEGYKYVFLEKELSPVGKNDYKIINPKIKKYIQDNDFDAILMGSSYWSPMTWMAIFAARKKAIPMVTRATVEADRKRNGVVLLLKKLVVGRYCGYMSAGVYECRSQKEYLQSYGMKEEVLFSSPCAVDNDFFVRQSKSYCKELLREELGIPENAVVFVATGMLIQRKRQQDIIEALIRLQKDGYKPYLYLVGDGSNRVAIEEKIEENGLENVYITGQLPQDEMCKYLKLADVYILASENDASPKALNEAMNFALPIIITTGVGTADALLKEGENGYIYPPGDINALYHVMKEIMDRNDREEMGEMSRKIVGRCDFNSIIEGWISAIECATTRIKGK